MSETDNPLKLLIAEFAPAFAAWLLGVPVQSVRPLNVEFPSRPLRSDLLFEVLNRQGQKHLLHVELQGRRSHQPMPYRTLEYMSQTAVREIPLPLGPGAPTKRRPLRGGRGGAGGQRPLHHPWPGG